MMSVEWAFKRCLKKILDIDIDWVGGGEKSPKIHIKLISIQNTVRPDTKSQYLPSRENGQGSILKLLCAGLVL